MSYVCVKDITAVIRQRGACMDWVKTRFDFTILITFSKLDILKFIYNEISC